MEEDILASIAVVLGLDDAPLQRGLGASVTSSLTAGQLAGDAFARQFGMQAGRGLGAWAGTLSQLVGPSASGNFGIGLLGLMRSTGQAASEASADLGYYRRQLEGIEVAAGRAQGAQKAANDAISEGLRIANQTSFGNEEIFKVAFREAGRTGDIGQALASTQNIVDAAASLGVRRQDFNRFQVNLPQLRNRDDRAASIVDLRQLQDVAPQLNAQLAQVLGVQISEVGGRIKEITGKELVEAIEEVGRRNRGRAAELAAADPREVAANIADAAKFSLAPTGDLINRMLSPVGRAASATVQGFDNINKATGGAAGLFLLATGVVLGTKAVYGATMATLRFTTALNAAALRLGGGGVGAPIFVGAGAAAAGAGSSALVPVGAAGAAASAPGGGLKPLVQKFGPSVIGLIAALTGGFVASKFMEDKRQTVAGQLTRETGAALGGAITGGGLGLALGGPLGGLAGAGLGGLVGLSQYNNQSPLLNLFGAAGMATYFYNRNRSGGSTAAASSPEAQKQTEAASKLDKSAENMARAADALQNVAGGGEVARRASQLLQLEFAGKSLYDAQLGRSAVTGFG